MTARPAVTTARHSRRAALGALAGALPRARWAALAGCLALAGCAVPGVPGSPAGTVAGPTKAPAASGVSGLDQLGTMVDTARSLAAQANGHASEVEALASRLGVPVASLVARLGEPAASSAVSGGALLCALITPVEIAAVTAVPVDAGVVGGSGAAQCQWSGPVTAGGQSRVAVRVTSAAIRVPHGAAQVPGVTGASYVSPVSHGWQAAARPGKRLVVVTMTGPKASRAAVDAVLALALARV